jgi:hypothetical protein
MPHRSLERLAAVSGLVLIALLVAARVIVPEPVLPESQAGGLVRSYYLDYRSLLGVRSGLVGLASLAAVMLIGALVGLLRRDGRRPWLVGVVLAGGSATVALWLAAPAALAALVELRQTEVVGATQGNAGGALALFQFYSALTSFTAWPLLAFVGAVSAWVLASEELPRWFGWVGLGFGGLLLLGLLVPPLPVGDVTEYCLWLWLTGLSVLLTLNARLPEPSSSVA